MPKITLTQLLYKKTPPWLLGEWGQKWVTQLGGKFDELLTWAKEGVKLRFVLECPDEALIAHGYERMIERAPGESYDDWRDRLWAAWETWKWAGTDRGIYNAFSVIGWTISPWITEPMWSWPPGWADTGLMWILPAMAWGGDCPDQDNDPTHFARFWILADGYALGYETDGTWGDPGTYDDGGAWDFSDATTADEVDRWKRMIRKWKDSQATCPEILMIMSDGGWADIWAPIGQWDAADEGTWQGTVLRIPVGEA
jgi:hypothetical protein